MKEVADLACRLRGGERPSKLYCIVVFMKRIRLTEGKVHEDVFN